MNKKKRMQNYILLFFATILTTFFILYAFFFKKPISPFQDCEFSVYQFEQDFFNIKKDSFSFYFHHVLDRFPDFFTDTSVIFNEKVFLDDTLRSVLDSVNSIFNRKVPMSRTLEQGFCNYQKHFPGINLSMYTFIDKSFDYRTPVVFANGKLFISLHLFLGSEHSFYGFLPDYIRHSHDTIFLPSSCFMTLAGRHIPYTDLDNFLEAILYYAKPYFFTQKMLPGIADYKLLKCPEDKIQWCYENESAIWRYMIEQDYLFSTSKDLIDRFINLAPYSQFGLPNDINSPGSIGAWLGLQIWNSYVAKTNVSLIEVLNETDYLKVLNNSGYKP